MGVLAVQEDGEILGRGQHSSPCGLGRDRGVRKTSTGDGACGRTPEIPPRLGDRLPRFCRVAGERSPAKVPGQPGILKGAGNEVGCCEGRFRELSKPSSLHAASLMVPRYFRKRMTNRGASSSSWNISCNT